MPDLNQQLATGCLSLGLTLSSEQQQQLLDYLALLQKWNSAYNLTAIRDPEQMVVKHLLDSLAVAPHLQADRVIDVGTGAGLPGVPLAIVYPQKEFHLLDSNGKKTRFLFQVKTALGLANISVHHRRVETPWREASFDAVVSRAFASLQDMVEGCAHLLHSEGVFLAMKGAYPQAELAAVEDNCRLLWSRELVVPGLSEQRHLLALAVNSRGG